MNDDPQKDFYSLLIPDGSGVLDKYAASHDYEGSIIGEFDRDLDSTTGDRRPNSPYIPRLRKMYKQETDFLRGYAASFYSGRMSGSNRSG